MVKHTVALTLAMARTLPLLITTLGLPLSLHRGQDTVHPASPRMRVLATKGVLGIAAGPLQGRLTSHLAL